MSLLSEVKRRKVFKVAAMYVVVAWLLIQVITSVEEPLNLPDWADSFVIVLLALGFPVSLILSWAFDVTPNGIRPAGDSQPPSLSSQSSVLTLALLGQVILVLAIAFLVVDQYVIQPRMANQARTAVTDVIRYTYRFEQDERLVPMYGVSLAVSSDGSRIAYIGPADTGTQLWIRKRDQLKSTPLPASRDAMQPFFAPAGQDIGFITQNGQLKVVSRIGDPPLTVVDSGVYPAGGSWGTDGFLYFSGQTGLVRKAASGGGNLEKVTITEPEGSVVIYHGWPDALPNGKGVIFTVIRDHLANEIAVVDLSSGQVRVLTEGILARYAESGHLVYAREDGGLMAVPFDQDQLTISGPEIRLGDQLPAGLDQDLALSGTGRLLYTTNNASWEVVWVERDGDWTPIDPEHPMRGIRYVALSPDDTKLALSTWPLPGNDDGHVWIKYLPRGAFAQLTFDGVVNMRPSWSPEGRSVIFISDRGENRDAWLKASDGATEAEVLLDDPEVVDEALLSRDGEWLVYRRGKEDGNRDIFAVRPGVEAESVLLAGSSFDEVAPALSPDSRWIAFVSNRGGKANVYVRPFPESDSETLVSVRGGSEPVWSRNRPELYYRNSAGDMVVVPILPGTDFETGPEQRLFSTDPYRSDFFHAAYDVSVDGERFVMIRASETGTIDEELIVVENLFQELLLLAPTD